MTVNWSLLLLLAALLPAGLSSQNLVGRVVDDSTGETIPNVALTLMDEDGVSSGFAMTDARGAFELEVSVGTYRLSVEGLGYLRSVSDTFVISWTRRSLDSGDIRPVLGTSWIIGGGARFSDRFVVNFGWRSPSRGWLNTTLHLRAGKFIPEDVLGAELFREDEFDRGTRPLLLSMLYGKEATIPIHSARRLMYARLSAVASFYGGEETLREEMGDSLVVLEPSVPPRVGFGSEFAVGVVLPSAAIRPWVELSLGAESVTRAGFRMRRPAFFFGIEFGRPTG